MRKILHHFFPFLVWLKTYRRADLPGDIIAGITVATMLIPQCIAYGLLAGVPPIVGLYTGMVPVIVYGLLGSSRFLTFGPTAITSVMVLSSLENIAEPGSDIYLNYVVTLTLFLGVVYVLMGILRLGFLVNLLSQPVLNGYINAAAIIILLSQTQHLLGIQIPRSSAVYDLILEPLSRLDDLNSVALGIGTASLLILYFFRYRLDRYLGQVISHQTIRVSLTRLGPIVVVLLSILLVFTLDLNATSDVQTIGDVPAGLPELRLPTFEIEHLNVVIPGALAIAFVGFMEGASTAKSLASRSRQKLDVDQELFAMGIANITSFLLGGFASTTSISRSSVNYATGSNSGLSSVVAGLCVMVTVLVLSPILFHLPTVALAAIIMFSVTNLIDFSVVRHLWQYSHLETLPFFITFLAVLLINIETGILSGVVLSVGLHLWRTTRVRVVQLGRFDYSNIYLDVTRADTQYIPSVLIVRIDESLYFANAQYLDKQLRNLVSEEEKLRYLILVCEAINDIDASALQILIELIEDLRNAGVIIYFAGVKEFVRQKLEQVDFVALAGADQFFQETHEAVVATNQLVDEILPI